MGNLVSLEGRIYAHRGCWNSDVLQNSLASFNIAIENRFSIETDVRKRDGRLVISHDSPHPDVSFELSCLTQMTSTFALNLKEDGLQEDITRKREWMEATNSFVFDGSIPEMYRYHKLGIRHALRISEFEKTLPWKSCALWLDSFYEDWWINDSSVERLMENTNTIVVSPELHGRDARFVWDALAAKHANGYSNFSICTDMPSEFLAWL